MRRSQRSHSPVMSAGRARALAAGVLIALLGGIGLVVTSMPEGGAATVNELTVRAVR